MNLKRFCTRFREMRTCYVGTKVSFLDKIFYAVDYVFAFIIHGASISVIILLMVFINLDIREERSI